MTANSARTAKLLTTCFAAAFFSQAASASVVNSFGFLTQPDSRGLIGNANNSTRNVLVSSAPAPGGITYLSITGGLTVINTASYAREACIEITCPSGRKYIAQPFATQSWTGTQAIPANTVVNFTQSEGTGVYQLRFFEQYQDSATGADAVWDNFQIAFHDGAAADVSPVNAFLDPTAEGPLVTVLAPFIVKANQTTADFIFTSPNSTAAADRVRIRGYVTTKNGWVANTSLAPSQYLRLNITAPNIIDGSPFTFTVTPFPTGGTSSGQFDLTLPLPQRASCGTGQTWRVSGTTVATGTSIATGTDLLEVVMSVQQLEIPRPTVEADLGVMRSRPTLGPVVSTPTDAVTTTLGSGQVKWFTFTTEQPLTNASGYWLDIHSQIPAGSPITDHWLALYENNGLVRATDDDGGSDRRSQLSFGQTSPVRPPVNAGGGPHSRNGFSGNLVPGRYYLAVCENPGSFSDYWNASSSGTNAGPVQIEFRTNLPQVSLPVGTDPRGPLTGNASITVNTSNAAPVKWLSFSVLQPVSTTSDKYLDITTWGTGVPVFVDTEIALFNRDGALLAEDDDDGGDIDGHRSMLTFGRVTPARPAQFGSIPGDGRDGSLPIGEYILAVTQFDMVVNTSVPFGASTGTASASTIPVKFFSNLVAPCGPADIGSQGGTPGADGLLDNNDFVVFIDLFFQQTPSADVGQQGGIAGADGFFDNNDFVVFINLFFGGCAD